MREIHPNDLTAKQVHEALLTAGWMPLAAINDTMHWVRENQHCIVSYSTELPAWEFGEPIEPLEFWPVEHFWHIKFVRTGRRSVVAFAA